MKIYEYFAINWFDSTFQNISSRNEFVLWNIAFNFIYVQRFVFIFHKHTVFLIFASYLWLYLSTRTLDLRLSVIGASIFKYNKQQQQLAATTYQARSLYKILTQRKSIKKADNETQWSNENWKVTKSRHKKLKEK